MLIAHPGSLPVALEAARGAGIPLDRVVVFDAVPGASNTTVHELIAEGLEHTQQFVERKLQPGEGKRKLAFLSFSSGTTGRPKVRIFATCRSLCCGSDRARQAVMIPHYAVLANVIQLAHWTKAKDESRPLDLQRHKPGSRNLAGEQCDLLHLYSANDQPLSTSPSFLS